ncbi:TadE/TadG family type IV pilus assembly protein [Propionicimonas paludicola]|uniref:TadE/TadG family type IV pilus assembly protein n=1 Tax=Propionicimonas paludicola TaxID=185243 RepID=UPI000BF40387|nr:TadE/TadG family type IV pilus assembly protein [Propionicimonas paludicola]
MRRGKPAQTSERGAAAVEFALVLPVLIVMIFGMVDMGMAINAQAIVGNAAREGARAASFSGADTTATNNAISRASASLIGTAPTTNITCQTMVSGTPTAIACSSVSPGDSVQVKVSYTYKWITPGVLGLPGQSVIVATSQMRIESA